MKTIQCFCVCAFVALVSACGQKANTDHKHGSGHVHVAPHGGTLVELGKHVYNLEFVRDNAAGMLTAYVLDGHAENFVRIAAPSIALVAMPGGKYTPVTLKAAANPVTGETVGDTSEFEAQLDWLGSAADFSGIFTVEIKGTPFEQVAFHLPK